MNEKAYFDADIDDGPIHNKAIAIVGYGAQGRAHALNLRDSGCQVIVGQRPGRGFEKAVADGFSPLAVADAAAIADVVCLMLPDERHGEIYSAEIDGNLRDGCVVLCCHGFSLLYRQVVPRDGIAAILVAPKGAGHMVRSAYEEGSGVPCLVALGPGAERQRHFPLALAYARALGGGRAGILETTLAEETETDLFGEQVVLCGGVSHLAAAAFETLVEAGYREEVAWFECVHELKLVVDLIHRGGLASMRDHISNTAEYGDYTRGPRIVDDHVRQTMREILAEIRDGTFAREWISETASGGKFLEQMRERHGKAPVERAGHAVHAMIAEAREPARQKDQH